MMKPAQERRLYKFVIEGKSCREIAAEEGTYHSSVSKSIEAAKKNFKKIYKNLWFWVSKMKPFVQWVKGLIPDDENGSLFNCSLTIEYTGR